MPPRSNSYNHAARKRTSTLPAALRTELEELGKIAPLPSKAGKLGRKDRRKDKRNEAKVNRAKNQQKRTRSEVEHEESNAAPPRPQKKHKDEPVVTKDTKKEKKSVKFAGLEEEPASSPPPAPQKKQTPLEKLLAKQQGGGKSGSGVDVVAKKGGRKNMTDEDKEIAWLEAKLGLQGPEGQMTKKDKGKWKEEFAEDGLDELFEGMDDLEAAAFGDGNKDYAKLLRESGEFSDLEFDLEEGERDDGSSEDEFAGMQSDDEEEGGMEMTFGEDDGEGEVDLDESEENSDEHDAILEELELGDEDEEMGDEDDSEEEDDSEDIESEFDGSELSFNEGDEEDESGAMTMTFGGGSEEPSAPVASASDASSSTGRYVPPHLRNKEAVPSPAASTSAPSTAKPSDSLEAPPDDPRLRRLLNGHLNKLSPQNISTINDSLLSLYSSHPRAIVSSVLTSLLLGIVSDRDNLGDQLMITYACLVAALFRTIGIEFPAGVLTHSITLLDKSLAKADAATVESTKEEEGGFEGKPGSKQAQNLVAFLSELYNFGVIGCGVVYDLIRLFIERGEKGLGELEVELLSKVVKRSGQQLRGDDPSALKEIISMVKQKMVGVDPNSMNSRTKFMIEQLTNLKNNKLPKLGADGAVDNYSGLKKYLVSLNKKRASGAAPDALRVSLSEIRSSSTRGKWWLVGAAWSGDPLLEAQQNGGVLGEQVRTKETKNDEKLVKLARSQGMNTEVRKGVFNVLMSSEDYVDACERLLQLGLSDVQQREIARVLLQCSGNEKAYNPYYTLVAQRLCLKSHSFQITLQYLLWDFLRDLGEKKVGGEELVKNMQDDSANATHKVPERKVNNLAKLYAWCVAKEALSISILKPVPFATVIPQTQTFLSTFFTYVFLSSQTASPAFVLPAKSSRRDREAVERIFVKAAPHGSLLKGLGFYLEAHGEELVEKARKKLGDQEKSTVKFAMKVTAETLSVGGIVDV
ncbi:Sgd1p [Sporobolomyces salmoneus]|uniref:Sgd1p n=1 Tax=Sporobolomyces salmoneus TaxID=183962 RepID=UPI003182842A